MSQFSIGKLLKIPRGSPELPQMVIELGELEAVELRKAEIAYVNKETAPELMYVFNKGYCEVIRMMAEISFEYTQAQKYANRRKAIVTLEVAPEILERKKLKTSEDLRRAIIEQDEEYLALKDKVYMIEASYEYLKGKAKGFEMAFQSVKKVYDTSNSTLGSVHSLHGGISEEIKEVNGFKIGEPRF